MFTAETYYFMTNRNKKIKEEFNDLWDNLPPDPNPARFHLIKDFIEKSLDQQRKEIGVEFWKWFNSDFNGEHGELIEEAIERITKVKFETNTR